MISLILNLHFYISLNKENENNLNNMRARALATLGSELTTITYFLDRFVDTMNYSIIHEEVQWAIARAEWEADVCTQGLSENSVPMYDELRRTAKVMENYFVWYLYGPINTTKVLEVTPLLYQIGHSFSGLDMLKDKNPLEYLYNSSVETVIRNCQQVQDMIQH